MELPSLTGPPALNVQPSASLMQQEKSSNSSLLVLAMEDSMPPSVEVEITTPAEGEDEEWEIDGLIPCCGIGVIGCFQNCSFPSCVGCHVAGQSCCCDLQYVRFFRALHGVSCILTLALDQMNSSLTNVFLRNACAPQESLVPSFNGGESRRSKGRRLGCLPLAQLFVALRRMANLLRSGVFLFFHGIATGDSTEK